MCSNLVEEAADASAPTIPASLLSVFQIVRSCFTAPSFLVFCHLAVGMATATGRRTVTGMLTAANLAGRWSHDRAHQFFSRAAWDPHQLGMTLARAVVAHLVPEDAHVVVSVDDTLFRRRGKKVHQARWAHDGSGRGKDKTGFGNTWVILAVIVKLPFLPKPVALPVLWALWQGKGTASRTQLAIALVTDLATALPGRTIDLVADAAYHHEDVTTLPGNVTWTFRLQRNAVLTGPTPPRTGRQGRPRKKGDKLGTPGQIAQDADDWTTAQVNRYGAVETVKVIQREGQWYGAFKDLPMNAVIVRDQDTATGYDLALLSTDRTAGAAQLVERYACRWPIEPVFQHGREDLGVGQAHNRTKRAVERTVPFGLAVYTLTVLWYTLHGYHPADITDRRANAPWYASKSTPALADMLVKLRRTVITAQVLGNPPGQPTDTEIQAVTRAWQAASA